MVVLLHKNTAVLVLSVKVYQVILKHIQAQIPPLLPVRREVTFAMKLISIYHCNFCPSDNC